MKNEKIVNYKDIGDVLYRRNVRAKNISIRINAEGIVKVTVPGWSSFHKAEGFVNDKKNWINQKLVKIKRSIRENLVWHAGDKIEIRNGRVFLEQGEGSTFLVTSSGHEYTILLPARFDPGNKMHSEALVNILAKIGYREGKRQLPEILETLAHSHNLTYTRLTVRRMKTRWGSCSSKNGISLNSALIFLPEELIEYVCLHELAHTVHKNHSQAFWDYLISILPDALVRRKNLRQQTIIA